MESLERLVTDPSTQEICMDNMDEKHRPCKPRYQQIKANGFYPIFINWKSSLLSSYLENLTELRQGEKKPLLGQLTAPLVLGYDIIKSFVRWPLVSANLVLNDVKTIPFPGYAQEFPAVIAKTLICERFDYPGNDCEKQLNFTEAPFLCPLPWHTLQGSTTPDRLRKAISTIDVNIGQDLRNCRELTGNFFKYIAFGPLKLITTPVIDSFGGSAWDVMLRRIDCPRSLVQNYAL